MENLVVELCCNMETMDEDEYEEKYNSLTPKYKKQVDAAALEFADNAVGSSFIDLLREIDETNTYLIDKAIESQSKLPKNLYLVYPKK